MREVKNLESIDLLLMLDAAPVGMIVVADSGQIRFINAGAAKLFGYPQKELIGESVDCLLPTDVRSAHAALRDAYIKEPEVKTMGAGRDLWGQRKDNSRFPVEVGLNPIRTRNGIVMIATVVDITARKKEEEHKDFLIGELNHRTKNLFSVLQSIATQTLRDGRDIAEAREAYVKRLHALAGAHSVLMEKSRMGAQLHEIVGLELFGFSDRFDIDGDPIVVRPSAIQLFALLFHELATNAAKFGALSTSSGHVVVRWKVRCEHETFFALDWIEEDGPSIVAPPERQGFGCRIFERAGGQLGKYNIEFAAAGFQYHLEAPLSQIGISAQSNPN